MELRDLVIIATYLHMVAKQNSNDLAWLFDKKILYTLGNSAHHEETQCLSFGNALWIASNDDEDSVTQQHFLTKIGISQPQPLLQHVQTYGTRILPRHKGKIHPNLQDKHLVLYELLGKKEELASAFTSTGATQSPGAFTLSSNAAPSAGGIVFVKGDYETNYIGPRHAEQKLLAALGLYLQHHAIAGVVNVAGVKAPCVVCQRALARVKAAVEKDTAGTTTIHYQCPEEVTKIRLRIQSQSHTSTAKLKFKSYFKTFSDQLDLPQMNNAIETTNQCVHCGKNDATSNAWCSNGGHQCRVCGSCWHFVTTYGCPPHYVNANVNE